MSRRNISPSGEILVAFTNGRRRWVGTISEAQQYLEGRNGRFAGHERPHWNSQSQRFFFPDKRGRCPACATGACRPTRLSLLKVVPRSMRRKWRSSLVGRRDAVLGESETQRRAKIRALMETIPRADRERVVAMIAEVIDDCVKTIYRRTKDKARKEFTKEDDEAMMQRVYGGATKRLDTLFYSLRNEFGREPWSRVPQLESYLRREAERIVMNRIRAARRTLGVKPILTQRGRPPMTLQDLLGAM